MVFNSMHTMTVMRFVFSSSNSLEAEVREKKGQLTKLDEHIRAENEEMVNDV